MRFFTAFCLGTVLLFAGGCQLFPRYVTVPAYYPVIRKPVMSRPIELPKADATDGQKAAIWERNAQTMFEYVEQLDAAVDKYNELARRKNRAVSVLEERHEDK